MARFGSRLSIFLMSPHAIPAGVMPIGMLVKSEA